MPSTNGHFIDREICNAKPKHASARSPTSGQKELFGYVGPVISLMRAVGLLPVKLSDGHIGDLSIDWRLMIYTCSIYSFVFIGVIYVYWLRMPQLLSSEATFNVKIYIAANFSIINTLILVPICYWLNFERITGYIKEWNTFLAYYEEVLGTYPKFGGNRCTLKAGCITASLATVLVTFTAFTIPSKYYLLAEELALILIVSSTTIIWYLFCRGLRVIAEDLSQHVSKISPTYSASYVRQIFTVSTKLCSLTNAIGGTFSVVISYSMVISFFSMILASFGHATRIIDRSFSYVSLTSVIFQICDVFNFYVVCNSAHYASIEVRDRVKQSLLDRNLDDFGSCYLSQIQKFLTSVHINPPVIQFAGFLDINRSLLIKVFSTVATYLIVLVQFQLTMPYQF